KTYNKHSDDSMKEYKEKKEYLSRLNKTYN
ncbi:MAG: hypothetical protein ACI9Y7_002622, partial [Dokdonia sp.]